VNNRERFIRTLNFQPVDRLPVIEWAGWWDKTLARFQAEGLPSELDHDGIFEYLGLDMHHQYWITPVSPTIPPVSGHGKGYVSSREDYIALKKYLYPDHPFDADVLQRWAERQKAGETAIWISLDGFFWFPRRLFGIEGHLYAFYDQPDLMKEMNEDLLLFNLRVLEQVYEICTPDFMTFGEDMSYNHGPMISREQFEEFMAPYYRQIIPTIVEHGTIPFVDTDGDITELVEWFLDVGVQGFLPLERMAGVDVALLREKYPKLRMIGGFDKTVMHLGEERMRQEFERLLPVMKQGGYIPCCDHQTPPEVSLEDYKLYVRLLKEYAVRATADQ
jgi:hypothetical protein